MAESYRAGLTRGEITAYPLVSKLSPSLKGVVVNWSKHDALYSPAGVWLALATAIFLSFALCIALSGLVATYTQTRGGRKRKGVLAHTWIKQNPAKQNQTPESILMENLNDNEKLRSASSRAIRPCFCLNLQTSN
jgi:hypothetical protein